MAAAGPQLWAPPRLLADRAGYGPARGGIPGARFAEVPGKGDGYLATFDGPARAIRCAGAVGEDAHELGIEVRAGIHTGECEMLGGD